MKPKILLMPISKLSTFLICLIYLFNPTIAFAETKIFFTKEQLHELNFTYYEKVNPNLQVFPLKKITEDLIFLGIFNKQDKETYFFTLVDNRFRELVYIINYDKTGFLFDTVHRYNAYVGKLDSDYQLTDDEKEKIRKNILLLERLRDRYHSGIPYWVKIQEAIDSTKRLI